MWLASLLRLLYRSWDTLVAALGTTTLSLLLFSVLIPMVPIVYRLSTQPLGKRPKGRSFRADLRAATLSRGTLVSTASEALIWLGLAFWAIAATVYREHRSLRLQVEHLTRPPYSIAPDDEWASMTNLMMSIQFLKQPFGQQPLRRCILKISAPPSNREPAQILAQEATELGCDISGPNHDPAEDLNSVRQEAFGVVPDAVIVHGSASDPRVDGFAVDLSNVFEVKTAHDLSSSESPDLIWLQFGPGNVWRKRN